LRGQSRASESPAPTATRAAAPRAIAPTTPSPRKVHWRLDSTPTGAAVIDGRSGALLGHTPWQSEPPAGAPPLALILRLAGYGDHPVFLLPTQEEERNELLTPLSKAPEPEVPPASNHGRPHARTSGRAAYNDVELLDSKADPPRRAPAPAERARP
jgi:hypothetical protein